MEDLKNTPAAVTVFGVLLPWSIVTYGVPMLVEAGADKVSRSIGNLASMVKKR